MKVKSILINQILKDMKRVLFTILLLLPLVVFGQEANYDESKVPEFTLPDLLTLNNGQKVKNAKQWMELRRPEILEIFTTEMFGGRPEKPEGLHFKQIGQDEEVYGGLGIRRRIQVCLDNEEKHTFEVLIHFPKNHKRPCPIFIGLNFKDKNDETIALESGRRWPYELILNEGFAVATATRNSIEPDVRPEESKGDGVRAWYEQMYPGKYVWSAISAWSWGISRIADYVETAKELDASRMIVIGHSRLGKTALWTGANDLRFAMVVSNNSGCCGAAITRRAFGENFGIIGRSFPHWFVPNFYKYNDSNFPVDQNGLAALTAPRPLYIASASQDLWADPKGEWLCAKSVQSVYDLFGKKGLESSECIKPGERDDSGAVGYKIRIGEHNVYPEDWIAYMKFAKRNLKIK